MGSSTSSMVGSSSKGYDPTDSFFQEVESVRGEIRHISELIKEMERLHRHALTTLYADEAQRTSRDIEELMHEINSVSKGLRNKLQRIGAENEELARRPSNGNADLRLRTNQVTQLSKKFRDVMFEYQRVQEAYKLKYRQQLQRQYKIVRPDASKEELDAILDADGTTLMAQQLFTVANAADAKRLLGEMNERHDEIMSLEKSVIELHQLFTDLAMLIEQQDDMVNNIETQVTEAAEYTNNAVVELKEAVVHQKSARKKKICLLVFCILVLAIVAIVIAVQWQTWFPPKK